MKHYKSVEFLSIFRMSSSPAQTQSPTIVNFLATVLHSVRDNYWSCFRQTTVASPCFIFENLHYARSISCEIHGT